MDQSVFRKVSGIRSACDFPCWRAHRVCRYRPKCVRRQCSGRSEEHTSELQSHSDLHSFPTRRSSDLSENRARFRMRASADRFAGVMQQQSQVKDEWISQFFEKFPVFDQLAIFRAGERIEFVDTDQSVFVGSVAVDRKSTRLNSSHTVIYTLSLHDALPI